MKSFARVVAAVLLVGSSSGCAVSGLSFVQDHRVKIVAPSDGETASLPLQLEWEARDVDGYFAVFFDRSPMRPGRDLASLVPAGDPCRTQDVCPDAAWLAEHDIYVTDQTSLVVAQLPDRRTNNRSEDRHEVVVVLLDSRGRRTGESVFTNEFIIERGD